MKKIAMIVKTNSLEFDDRIRKVSLALSKDADGENICIVE